MYTGLNKTGKIKLFCLLVYTGHCPVFQFIFNRVAEISKIKSRLANETKECGSSNSFHYLFECLRSIKSLSHASRSKLQKHKREMFTQNTHMFVYIKKIIFFFHMCQKACAFENRQTNKALQLNIKIIETTDVDIIITKTVQSVIMWIEPKAHLKMWL